MSLALHRSLPIRTAVTAGRSFSSAARRCISLQLEKNDLDVVADTIPAYPYGPAQWYKQSDLGLYGGKMIQFGNNVGPKSKYKTRRSWLPNVFNKRLFSRALGRHIQLRVTTRALRTIDKVGGLDEYLLGDKEARIKELGITGWWLRWAIMQTPEIRHRFKAERQALGLPEKGIDEIIQEEMTTEQGEVQIDANVEASVEDAAQVPEPIRQRIKFRAGPRAHLYYTPDGWRRAKPDAERKFKERMRKHNQRYLSYYYEQLNKGLERVDALIAKQKRADERQLKLLKRGKSGNEKRAHERSAEKLLERQRIAMRRRVRSAVEEQAEKIIQALWDRKVAVVQDSKLRKPIKKAGIKMTSMEKQTFQPKTRAEVRAWIRRRKEANGEGEAKTTRDAEAVA